MPRRRSRLGRAGVRGEEFGERLGMAVVFVGRGEYGDEEGEFWQVASLWRREYRELRKPCLPCAAGIVAAARQE